LLYLAINRNKLNYIDFRSALIDFKVFSIVDVIKIFPGFDSKRLVEWQKKKYIRKIVNKWYVFAEIPLNEMLLYRISNCIYRPSYISLETALSYYNLIPEAVFSLQAISTRKTTSYITAVGTFNYRTIKSSLYFGYMVHHIDKLPVLIADEEKALLDFLYLSAQIVSEKDLITLRFNYNVIQNKVDWEQLHKYALVYESKTLDKRINYLKKIFSDAHPA
jgi:predicted transcriptional regulator of viral defense system